MRVCLASSSDREFLKDELNNVPFLLESFYYIKDWQIELVKNCKMFLLDSGAFTFMRSFKKTINWFEYIDSYAHFIIKNNIDYFFELDIDNIIGIKEVERLRTYLEQKTHKKCIPVWHKSRGLNYWIKMCQEYKYVAIGGIITKEIKPCDYKYFKPLLSIANKYGCKVHGLGFTSIKQLKNYSFYSVDSLNWKSGGLFGQIAIFDGQSIKLKKIKNVRVKDYKLLDRHNLQEWIKFVNYADKFI